MINQAQSEAQIPAAPPAATAGTQSLWAGVHGLWAIALGAFLGGPIACAFLVYANSKDLAIPHGTLRTASLFVPLIALWLVLVFNVPPDFISQFIPYVLQLPLWWLGARYILAKAHREFKISGGTFRSTWIAVRIGLITWGLLKISLFVLGNSGLVDW